METESKRISITLSDNRIIIMSFITTGYGSVLPYKAAWLDETKGLWQREANDENIFHEISRMMLPEGTSLSVYRIISEADIPEDRTFRNALRDAGDKLEHDLGQCKEIHLGRLRTKRRAELEKLDKDWMKAFSCGDTETTAAIEAKRQALRDMPGILAPNFDNATTPEELKQIDLNLVLPA